MSTQYDSVIAAEDWIDKQGHWSEIKKLAARRVLLRYYLRTGHALSFGQWLAWSTKFDKIGEEIDDKAKV